MVVGRRRQPLAQGSPRDLDPLLTPAQVGDYLGVPLGTLANWRYQGRGPAYVRFGRHVRYREQDITAWIDDLADH
jgi:excisionase family DNA binding protein